MTYWNIKEHVIITEIDNDDGFIDDVSVVYSSMTIAEKNNWNIILNNESRVNRIASGSGLTTQDVIDIVSFVVSNEGSDVKVLRNKKGTKKKKVNGLLVDVVTLSDGTVCYYENNKLHRSGGPAVVRPNGVVEWWYNGEKTKR